MKWAEKAAKVIGLRQMSKADVDRAGGLSPGTTAQKMKPSKPDGTPTEPGAYIGVQIARGLGVPCEWLFDDQNSLDASEIIESVTYKGPVPVDVQVQHALASLLARMAQQLDEPGKPASP